MTFQARALWSLFSALLICTLPLGFIKQTGKYLPLPGYLALGAYYFALLAFFISLIVAKQNLKPGEE